jgi:drug/metabolite transporter (DMT)-like permease
MILAAAATYAFAPLIFKRRFAGIPPVGAVSGVMLVGSLVFLPAAAVSLPTHSLQPETWLSLIVLGAGGTGVSFYCFYELINEVGAARASLVAYTAPIFAVIYGVTLLDEPFTLWALLGMALIFGGSWLAARRPQGVEAVSATPARRP